MGEQSNEFQMSTFVFYRMLCNAFQDEKERNVSLDKLELNGETDLNETVVAMVAAIFILCKKLDPENFGEQDLLGFTHILNRLVVQHSFMKYDEEET